MNGWHLSILRISLIFFVTTSFAQPVIEKGTIDLRKWDFEHQGSVRLDGQWGFYWQELLVPSQESSRPTKFQQFPGIWEEGQGFATYTADVIIDRGISTLSLDLPDIYTSYQLWVNGVEVANNGEVGTSRKETSPQWLPKTVVFAATDTLHIMMQIANFHHMRGGSNDHIYLGLP